MFTPKAQKGGLTGEGVPVATLCEWKTKEGSVCVCAFARDNLMDGGLGKQGILLIVKLSRNGIYRGNRRGSLMGGGCLRRVKRRGALVSWDSCWQST